MHPSTELVRFDAGYESVSGFRDAFDKLFQLTPGRARSTRALVVKPGLK